VTGNPAPWGNHTIFPHPRPHLPGTANKKKISLIAIHLSPVHQDRFQVFPLSQPERSLFARLVIFVVCLSVAGLVGAAALPVTGILTQQQNLQPPVNSAGAMDTITGGSPEIPYNNVQEWTCIKDNMKRCEKACMMPSGLMDMDCYEYCIDEVCYGH
jgi:hypothetical protein